MRFSHGELTSNNIYLNTAACGLMSTETLAAVKTHLELEQQCGGYTAEAQAQKSLNNLKINASQLLGCHPSEVAFTDSGTRAWLRALESVDLQKNDVVLTSPGIWGGNYFTLLQHAKQRGVVVKPMPELPNGQIDTERLGLELTPAVKLIEVCHAPSGWDLWQPLEPIVSLAKKHSIPVLVDACQSVGQHRFDLDSLECELLISSGRKWLKGPRGTGILFVRKSWSEKHSPLGLGQHQANLQQGELLLSGTAAQFDLSETSIALRLGLSVAMSQHIERFQHASTIQTIDLCNWFRSTLSKLPNLVTPNFSNACDDQLGRIVTFTHATHPAQLIATHLRNHGIEVAVHPARFMPLHSASQARGDCIRASVDDHITLADLERTVQVLKTLPN